MASGSPDLGAPSRPSVLATSAVVVLSVAFLVALAVAVATAAGRVLELDDRRTEALAARFDPVVAAGPATEAFRRFRSTLDGESRFALVFGPGVDRNQRGIYRLVGGYYLYPAIAVAQPISGRGDGVREPARRRAPLVRRGRRRRRRLAGAAAVSDTLRLVALNVGFAALGAAALVVVGLPPAAAGCPPSPGSRP